MKEYRVSYRTWTSIEKFKNGSRKVKALCRDDADRKVMSALKDKMTNGIIKHAILTDTEEI